MTPERKEQYRKTYMQMACDFSSLSEAIRSKVGCIIVSKEGQILSQGYNGMPSGMSNKCEYLDEDGKMHTNPEVLHAETNAILKCAKNGISTNGAECYVTLSPCLECAKVIAQAGISAVYYKDKYRNTDGIELLSRLGIRVRQIDNLTMPTNLWHCVDVGNVDVIISDIKHPKRAEDGSWEPATIFGRKYKVPMSKLNECVLGDVTSNDKPTNFNIE